MGDSDAKLHTAATEPAADIADASATSDNSADRSAEGRIAGLVAERNRVKDASLAKDQEIVKLKNELLLKQTAGEKQQAELIQAKVQEIYGADIDRWKGIEEGTRELATAELATLPEKARALVDTSAPPHVQLRQIRTAHELLADKAAHGVVGGGNAINPEIKGDSISRAQFDAWQASASSMDPEVRASFFKLKPKMDAAYKANRIR